MGCAAQERELRSLLLACEITMRLVLQIAEWHCVLSQRRPPIRGLMDHVGRNNTFGYIVYGLQPSSFRIVLKYAQ
jgi:hypothetical protein